MLPGGPQFPSMLPVQQGNIKIAKWFLFILLFWFWGITEQIVTSVEFIIENFIPSVCEMLLSISDLVATFYELRV